MSISLKNEKIEELLHLEYFSGLIVSYLPERLKQGEKVSGEKINERIVFVQIYLTASLPKSSCSI